MLDNYDDYKTGGTHKVFSISVVGENITITNENLRTESIVLDEELCSSTNLKFGSCGTSKFTAEIANVFENFEGKLINVTVTMDNEVTKYGTFKVFSDKPIADRIFRSLTAYDAMNDIIKTNVLSWYKSLTFPMTLKNFRDSFFNYLGITQETTTLVNDNFIIPGGFTASDSLMGGTIITAICELNGVFGHINRDGKFEYIDLTQSESFECPPYENGSVTYEDYVTSPITKVTMRGTASDVGTSVGVAGNEYIIQGNPLIYGTEGTQALTTAITNLLNKIKTIVFRPFDLRKTIGNPCVEIGDAITIDTKYETITSYVLRRTLTGIQALRDRYSASGSRVYPAVATSYSNEITRTQGKIHEVEVSLDEFRSEVSQTYVTQTAYNSKIQELQDEIDGAIESFTGSAVPTLNNYPASDWTTTTEKDKHIGDLYQVNSQGGSYAGFYYRFDKTNNVYSWVHIPDNEVQKALSDAAEANRKAEAAQATADGIADDLSDNYSTTQQMNSAINQKADEIELAVSQTYATQQTVTNVKNSTIKNDVLHYLATSAGSGVTRSTPGWTTTVQSMTETNQYLWTYHTYTYGDDHTSDTDPIITGRYGQNGSQGPQGATGPQGPQGEKGDTGDTGAKGYSIVTSVTRNTFTTADWTAYCGVGHTESWNGTSSTRNGCRIGDLFTVVGTATDTGRAYTATFRSTTDSGDLRGTSISLVYADKGDTGAQGPQGNKGDTGDQGISIVEVVPLYYASNSTTAPAAPTSNVTRTDTATRVWTRGIPALTSTDKYMYTCDQVKYSNNNYTWTSVVLDNSLTNLTERMTQAELDLQPDSITAKVSSTNTFTTLQQFNALAIGGRNLIRNTGDFKDAALSNGATVEHDTSNNTYYVHTTTTDWGSVTPYPNAPIESINGKTVTISAEVRLKEAVSSQTNSAVTLTFNGYSSQTGRVRTTHIDNWFGSSSLVVNKWVKISRTVTVDITSWTGSGDTTWFSLAAYNHTTKPMDFRYIKVEEGNKATDWTPAPEDLDDNAKSYANTAETTAKSYTDSQIQVSAAGILSTVEQGYTTKTDFNNLKIGGENLFPRVRNGNAEFYTNAAKDVAYNDYTYCMTATGSDMFVYSVRGANTEYSVISGPLIPIKPGESVYIKVYDMINNTNVFTKNYINLWDANKVSLGYFQWYYTEGVYTCPATQTTAAYMTFRFGYGSAVTGTRYKVRVKIERGNKPTAWSPAQDDIDIVGTNLLRYAPKSKAPTSYQALQLNLTEKLVKGQTYTLQLWDINISNSGKQASELNAAVFAGGGNNLLANITGFTNGHADYKTVTFTVPLNPSQPTHLDNLWLNIYNSPPNSSATMNLTIGSWKLEKGNKATEWQMNPIDASSKSEVEQLSNMVAIKVNSSGRLVTAALGVDPASATSYVKVKADDIDIISNGNIQLTGKSIGITSTNFTVTSAGVVTCSNITATGGSIGGWTIESDKLSKTNTGFESCEFSPWLLKLSDSQQANIAFLTPQLISVPSGLFGGIGCGYETSVTSQALNIDFNGNLDTVGNISCNKLLPKSGSEVNINGACLFNTNGNAYVTGSLQLGSASSTLNCGIEIFGSGTPYIDFHLNHSSADFTARIVHRAVSNTNYIDFIASSSTWIDCRAKSFANQSSKHVKKNIKNITDAEAKKLLELRPVKFDYKFGGAENQRGLIAEEVNEIMPEMVIGADAEFNKDEPWNTPSIDYSKFVPYLIKMIQILQTQIDDLKK